MLGGRPFFSTLASFSMASSSVGPGDFRAIPQHQFDRFRHVLVVLVPQYNCENCSLQREALPRVGFLLGRPSLASHMAAGGLPVLGQMPLPASISTARLNRSLTSSCRFGTGAAREVPEISTSLMHFTAIGAIFSSPPS